MKRLNQKLFRQTAMITKGTAVDQDERMMMNRLERQKVNVGQLTKKGRDVINRLVTLRRVFVDKTGTVVPVKYREHAMLIDGQRVRFHHCYASGWTRVPGISDFRAESIDDARDTVRSLYSKEQQS